METFDPIHELLHRQVPEKLWHYTSVQGFVGIVSSKSIFVTDARFLNDREELIHASKIVTEVVEETTEFGPNKLPTKEYLQMAVDQAFETGFLHPSRSQNPSHSQIFVASFSAVEDHLSQWRGYSHGTSGVSLGFQLGQLRARKDPALDLALFAPCVYRPSQKKDLIRHALHRFLREVQAYYGEIDEEVRQYKGPRSPDDPNLLEEVVSKSSYTATLATRLPSAVIETTANLLIVAALLKDESFSEEQEWRLVLPVLGARKKPRYYFRAGNTTLIPYVAYPFSDDPDAPVPLADLILGPGSHSNAAHAALSFLKSEGIMTVPRESSVPYRPW